MIRYNSDQTDLFGRNRGDIAITCRSLLSLSLGKGSATKSDDFLEKYQTAFDPPLIFGKLCCNFFIIVMVAFMQGGIGQIVSVDIS